MYVCIGVSWMCMEVRSQFSPSTVSMGDRRQASHLGGKCPYLFSHLASLSCSVLTQQTKLSAFETDGVCACAWFLCRGQRSA